MVEVFGKDFDCGETPEWTSIHQGDDQMKIAPGTWHRFRAQTDCLVTEVYWTDQIDPIDIERADEGGIECRSLFSEAERISETSVLPSARSLEFRKTLHQKEKL